jgi:hypothetical protein
MKLLMSAFMITIAAVPYAQQIATYSNIGWLNVSASVKDKNTRMPIGGIKGYLSLPGTNFTLSTAESDSLGNLNFLIKKPARSAPFVFQIENSKAELIVVPGNSSAKKFTPDLPGGVLNGWIDTLPFYGTPDKQYMLDDYTRFSTLEEILIEYVREVRLIKKRGRHYFEVLNAPFQTFFSDAPVVLLDGVPVFDIDKLMSLDPLRIMKIEVMARKYYLGPFAWNGVVSFVSYDGSLAGYTLPPETVIIEYTVP